MGLLCCFYQSGFLEMTANLYFFGYISLPAPTGNNLLNESMLEWSRSSCCFYATSRVDEDLFSELQSHNWRVIAVGWAFADSVLHRLAPLWIGARGLEFTWEYIFQGLEANANLVMTLSLAALGSLMWLRKKKPRTLTPIIYACALLLATMPSITRLSHYHAAVTLKGNNYHAPTYVIFLFPFFKKQFLVMM
ncbi:uncharacterized protein LOC123440526 [Hordeum vulgare subsp. vulgare]|uniref:uncharacterized protein LOC123440526 n=1 Tax=Hordeum vulgare subsp. vulgare TaxID=112509 RepID=UPI001D1A42C3|nr:uncharacterized protein LOC123440526 [Hordeum vulgare subsp. vulgare]